jgi:uncharacterized membrane protein
MTMSLAPAAMTRGSSRWLLLGSLALNLFFVGIALAMAVRPAPAPTPSTWDPDVFVRMERIAQTLPAEDAAILRAQIEADRATVATAQKTWQGDRNQIRETLRQEPFDAAALRSVMARSRADRQTYDSVLQNLFADASSKMSREGRLALANWPPNRRDSNQAR